MSRFDRYMLSQLMVLFGFFSLVMIMVYWVNRAVLLFNHLISDGQSVFVFLEFTALTLPNVIRIVLPVSAFAAAVYVTNRLTRESEMVVVQSAGFSPFRLARGTLVFGAIVALLMSVLVHVLVPISRTMMAERRAEMDANVTARLLTEGQFLHPATGLTLFIRHISTNGELHGVFLSDARRKENRTTYTAKRAVIVKNAGGPKLVMFDGMAQTFTPADKHLSTTRFKNFTFDLGAMMGGVAHPPRTLRDMNTAELLFPTPALMAETGKPRRQFTYEANIRLAEPLSAMAAAFLGFAPLLLGGFSRFGLRRQIGLAIALLVGLQLLTNLATDFADSTPRLWPLVYLPVLYGFSAGALALWVSGRTRRRRRGAQIAPEAEAAA